MRKLLLTTAFILPLSFVPALAQDATAPATDAPATDMTTEAVPADTMAEPETDAMAAEMASSDMVTTEQGPGELRLDWITGTTVMSPTGDSIGDIADLILDGESGQVKAAVLGVGGFLGIGEKQIAVPFDQITINYDAQEITSELTKEQADAAPEYVFREREAAPAADGTMAPAADGAMAPAMDAPADAPAMDAPAADAPAMDAPADAPAMDAPAEAPAMDAPATDAPAMDAPAADAPAMDAPADAPAMDAPADATTPPAN